MIGHRPRAHLPLTPTSTRLDLPRIINHLAGQRKTLYVRVVALLVPTGHQEGCPGPTISHGASPFSTDPRVTYPSAPLHWIRTIIPLPTEPKPRSPPPLVPSASASLNAPTLRSSTPPRPPSRRASSAATMPRRRPSTRNLTSD